MTLLPSKQQLRAEIAEWQAAYGRLAREYVDAAERVVLPADQADPAPKLAEAATKPRACEMGWVTAKYSGPETFLINQPTASDDGLREAACGCRVPEHMLYVNGRAECVDCQPKCSGNSGIPCGTETSNFPNIEKAS
ncbi:hypothetical protein ACFWU5_16700 [Nocardia sp. NPDC058640]|uniref:hypothetical protein n=1 Tax=Nocardia sp. NPDC058640 TaxID=3346571 RepID=UPI00365FC16A